MKHDVLRSVAHNLADSFACGNGFLIGYYPIDVFGEASRSPSGLITVDFLQGTVAGAPSGLEEAVRLYRDALPDLCVKQGVSVSDFSELLVQFSKTSTERRFTVTVVDRNGRQSVTKYCGLESRRLKAIDKAGRQRPKPIRPL
jgi:hypothetical protein